MTAVVVRVFRWLLGRPEPTPRHLCHFCENDYHVHDVNTAECITTWCECSHD